jgi:hypothetical protein
MCTRNDDSDDHNDLKTIGAMCTRNVNNKHNIVNKHVKYDDEQNINFDDDDEQTINDTDHFHISREHTAKVKMPRARKWGQFMGSLDVEEQDDVLVITGKSGTHPHRNPPKGKILMTIEGTMDSGASNSVAPIEALPGVKISESAGSKSGQHYVSAGNDRIPNVGEQLVHFKTKEGHRSSLKWQCAPVTKPLLSISHICDAGHRVTFEATGGYMVNLKSGRKTSFRRKNNVYVLDMVVEVDDVSGGSAAGDDHGVGFHRQG